MITRSVLVGGGSGLLAQTLVAQEPVDGIKTVFSHDVPDLALKGWSGDGGGGVVWTRRQFARAPHPGVTIAYVLTGEIRSGVGDGPERTYKAGQMFLEVPGQRHAVSRNASTARPAKLLAIMLTEKGKQLTTPER